MKYTCATLPVSLFERCTVTGDLSELGKTEDDQKDCWLAINSEYCLLVEDTRVKTYVNEVDRMQHLTGRIYTYTTLVNILRCWPLYEKFEDALRDEFDVSLDREDKEQYQADLDFVLIRLKEDEIELSQLEAMQQVKGVSIEKKSNVQEGYFDDLIVEIYLRLFEKPVMNLTKLKDEMMTKELAMYIKRLKAWKPVPKMNMA